MSRPNITHDDFNKVFNRNLIYNRNEIDWYAKFNRFGCIDPFNKLTSSREYLFFTKPDCNILASTMTKGTFLQPALQTSVFFQDMYQRYPRVLQQLQRSAPPMGNSWISRNPFMVLLSNGLKSTLDLPSLSASSMENASNMYGTTMMYRKDAWTGDENIDFSLEFEDTKFTEIYMLVKAYEEYERMVNFGLISPPNPDAAIQGDGEKLVFNDYTRNKELHDVFGIYKIVVGEDGETIIFYAYVCGAYFTNVPRDAFNNLPNDNNGLDFSIDFHAFCCMDMDPRILSNFNRLIINAYGKKYAKLYPGLPIYGSVDPNAPGISALSDFVIKEENNSGINGEWAGFPAITLVKRPGNTNSDAWYSSQDMKYQYKLKWFKY